MIIDKNELNQMAAHLSEELFGADAEKKGKFTGRLLNSCAMAADKDFLLIHNPGGWGTTRFENLLQWERSIVEGVHSTMTRQGYDCALVQYFRSEPGWRSKIFDLKEQKRFFSEKARIMAAEVNFLIELFNSLHVLMIGVSQGAAFTNAVQQRLKGQERVCSLEIGTPFFHKSKRVLNENNLALDDNGLMPDALMEWDVPTIISTYATAPFRWLKHRIRGEKIKFTYCINLPGHDYNWEYPEVQGQIERFLVTRFGENKETEVENDEAGKIYRTGAGSN